MNIIEPIKIISGTEISLDGAELFSHTLSARSPNIASIAIYEKTSCLRRLLKRKMASKLKIQAKPAKRYPYKVKSILEPEVKPKIAISMMDINQNRD